MSGTASSRGDTETPGAPRDVVEAFQRDLLRVAFALTGNGRLAPAMARNAFIDVLSDPDEASASSETRSRLLAALGRSYLTGVYSAPVLEIDQEQDSPAERERANLRAALVRFNRPTRAALILHDLGGLDAHETARLTGFEPDDLDPLLDRARERLRDAAGDASGGDRQQLVSTLAVGAPEVDLWPEIEPALAEREAGRQRRFRRGAIAASALVLIGVVVVAVWLAGGIPFLGDDDDATVPDNDRAGIASPQPTDPTRPTDSTSTAPAATPTVEPADLVFPSELQIQAMLFEETPGERIVFNYEPEADQALVEVPPMNASIVYTSADGSWTVLHRLREASTSDGQAPARAPEPVLTVARDGDVLDWEYVVPVESAFDSWNSAVLGDRLYVALAAQRSPELTILDLETGEVLDTLSLELPVDLPEPFGGSEFPRVQVQLFPFAGGDTPQLYALVTALRNDAAGTLQRSRSAFRIDLDQPGAELLHTRESAIDDHESVDFSVGLPGLARILPEGSGLYMFDESGQAAGPAVQFLDFESGDVTTVEMNFSVPGIASDHGVNIPTISNDGGRLYIYSNHSGEVAIVDLAGRRIERTFPLDLGDIAGSPVQVRSAHLSHDGQWMYLIDASAQWFFGIGPQPPESTAVWVVDLSTWRLSRQVDVPGYIQSLYPDPAGDTLHVVSQVPNPENPQRWRAQLIRLEIGSYEVTGTHELSDLTEANAVFELIPASDAYRATYGHTPVIDGVEPDDIEEFTTLPRARVVVDQELVPVSVAVPVALEILDPATGEPLEGPDSRVRYDPTQPHMLVFEKSGSGSPMAIPAELSPGQLSGTVRFDSQGYWNARINVGDGMDSGYTVLLPEVLRCIPTFEGDDGRAYALHLETEPTEPIPTGEEIVVRGNFVDAITGEPIPASVSLMGGLPEEMRLGLTGTETTSYDLVPIGHGVYEGTITIAQPGPMSARLIFVQPESGESRATQVEMGTLGVQG